MRTPGEEQVDSSQEPSAIVRRRPDEVAGIVPHLAGAREEATLPEEHQTEEFCDETNVQEAVAESSADATLSERPEVNHAVAGPVVPLGGVADADIAQRKTPTRSRREHKAIAQEQLMHREQELQTRMATRLGGGVHWRHHMHKHEAQPEDLILERQKKLKSFDGAEQTGASRIALRKAKMEQSRSSSPAGFLVDI